MVYDANCFQEALPMIISVRAYLIKGIPVTGHCAVHQDLYDY
jgi:hypothetical protein